jgi:hypothetical protein
MNSSHAVRAVLVAALTLTAVPVRADDSVQVTMTNKTNLTLDLYINDRYGCRALPHGLYCTATVAPGDVHLDARYGSRVVTKFDGTALLGTPMNWLVCDQAIPNNCPDNMP